MSSADPIFQSLTTSENVSYTQDEKEETPQPTSPDVGISAVAICGWLRNICAFGILALAVAVVFVQIQAVTLQVTLQQRQIDQLNDQIKVLNDETKDINVKVEEEHSLTVFHIAGTFTLLTCLITMFHMAAHLRAFNAPIIQRKIISILWLSPIYSLTSFCSLLLPVAEEYLGLVKDFYEAYVIYQFVSFLICVLGKGDRNTAVEVLSKHAHHLKPPCRCLNYFFHPPPESSDEAMAKAVLLECQVLAMQFVMLKPLMSIIHFAVMLGLNHGGLNGDNAKDTISQFAYYYSPQFLVAVVQNLSVFLAFGGLLKLYYAARDDISWCQPLAKFMTIKGVVFMTFWQALVISVIFYMSSENEETNQTSTDDASDDVRGSVDSPESLQHVLICMEMLLSSIAHWCVFPTEEWKDGYIVQFYEKPGFGFGDFASEVSMVVNSSHLSRRAARDAMDEMNTALEAEEEMIEDVKSDIDG